MSERTDNRQSQAPSPHGMGMRREYRYAHVAVALLWLACVLPQVAQWYLYTDGLTYSTIARQLSLQPFADWWHLHFTGSVHPDFYEHPPLGFWLMALWYRYVVANRWAEALYALFWLSLLFVSLSHAARRLAATPAGSGWYACLLLMACPLTSWLFVHLMLEGPLLVTVCAGLAAFVAAQRSRRWQGAWGYGALGGACATAGILIKGPTAMAALAVPVVLLYGSDKQQRRMVLHAGVAAAVVVLGAAAFLASSSEAVHFLQTYLQQQVVRSVRGERELTGSRWKFLYYLLTELALPAAVVVTLAAVARRRLKTWRDTALVRAVTLALLASLPLAVSVKQHRWYLAASLPYYALALAYAGAATSQAVTQALARAPRFRRRARGVLALVAVALMALTLQQAGQVSRKQGVYRAYLLPRAIAEVPTDIGVCPPQLFADFWLHSFFARYFSATLWQPGEQAPPLRAWLVRSDCPIAPAPACRQLNRWHADAPRLLLCPLATSDLPQAPPL